MTNQIKKTQDIIRENGNILKDTKKQGVITEEQQKKLAEVMSSDEVAEYVSQKKKKTQDTIKQTRDDWKKTEGFQETVKTRKEDIALINQVAKKMDVSFEEAYNMLHGGDELQKKTFEKKESKETGKITHEHLLNKPNMTAKDKENMEKSIKFLVDKKMDTSENLKKLEAINYGTDYREIGGVKFSRENLIPEVKFNDKPNQYNVFESNEKGIYKTIYNGKPEHYLTIDAYIAQAEKQGKKTIKDTHIRKALQALPGEFSYNNWYEGANIMGNILDLSMSGYVNADGKHGNNFEFGSLCSASPVFENTTRAFNFLKDKGTLYDSFSRSSARPCLFVVE